LYVSKTRFRSNIEEYLLAECRDRLPNFAYEELVVFDMTIHFLKQLEVF
jgi:hypothetical protein